MRLINKIIIHCADTPEGVYYDIQDIRKWHVQENGWSDVGYHYIILLDGTIQKGRSESVIGAHCKDNNSSSIGICYIGGANGKDTRTNAQKASLVYLLSTLRRVYTMSKIHSHSDFSTKTCPSFDATNEYKNI